MFTQSKSPSGGTKVQIPKPLPSECNQENNRFHVVAKYTFCQRDSLLRSENQSSLITDLSKALELTLRRDVQRAPHGSSWLLSIRVRWTPITDHVQKKQIVLRPLQAARWSFVQSRCLTHSSPCEGPQDTEAVPHLCALSLTSSAICQENGWCLAV